MHKDQGKISGIVRSNSTDARVKTWSKKTSTFLLLPLLILSMATTLGVASSAVSETTRVYVNPPQLVNHRLAAGHCSTYQSWSTTSLPIQDSRVRSFKFFYDPALLSARVLEDVMFHEVTPQAEWDNIWALQNEIDNSVGCVDICVHVAKYFESG